ncbi:hypothetical protein ACFQZR_09695 [Paenibacillus sp. GCM10027629]|uniref:hypothetical protein n=1 Tax=Paenibacillus sp. GCM10027629 TaxID=3273414 RepID=UPI003641D65C
MVIANNIIKHHFENIYFITGSACGGKTTVSKFLANKYDLILYSWDDRFAEYQAIAHPNYQPAMSQRSNITSWEEYFMRPVEAFADWLASSFKEQTSMATVDLLRLSGNVGGKKIIVDGFFTADILKEITDYSRVFFLLASEEVIRHDYFNREEKREMLECINGLKNPNAAIENTFHTMLYKQEERDKAIRESGFRYNTRDNLNTNPLDLIREVEEHFGFGR